MHTKHAAFEVCLNNTYSGRIVRRSLSSDVSPPDALRLAIFELLEHLVERALSSLGYPGAYSSNWR